jgi:glycopeptide antibiotics resistance protein
VHKRLDLPRYGAPEQQKQFADLATNVLLFVPLGALALLAFPDRARRVAVSGPLLSCVIEAFQGLFLPHRDASVRDVAANSAGYLLGFAAVVAVVSAKKIRLRGA